MIFTKESLLGEDILMLCIFRSDCSWRSAILKLSTINSRDSRSGRVLTAFMTAVGVHFESYPPMCHLAANVDSEHLKGSKGNSLETLQVA